MPHRDTRLVERPDRVDDLLGGEAVAHRVRAVPQSGVGDAQLASHAACPFLVMRSAAIRSPTRVAAAVMMSRLPA